jgi:flagellar basal-body rod protein FlgG
MSTFAMHVAKTGLNSQQIKMQVIANNLANVNTTGFKADRTNFESLLYQVLRSAGENTSENTSLASGLSVGTGTRLLNTSKIHSQGSLINTGNSLDLSVEGDGFFQVLLPDGKIGYTRNGAFMRNAEGTVVTASGYPLQPEIQIPADAATITVASDGIVTVQVPGDVDAQEVGQITLADFSNRQGLQPNGESMLIETPASGAPIIANPFAEGMGRLVQGSLESSNVNVVQELVDMIETQRAYEVSSKTITSVDEMMRFIAQNI